MLRRFDDYPDGKLDLLEPRAPRRRGAPLLGLVVRRRRRGGAPRVRAAFEYYDRNRSGYLDYRELRDALRHMGLDATYGGAATLLRRYDDPDGRMDVHEFHRLVQDLSAGVYRGPGYSAHSHGSSRRGLFGEGAVYSSSSDGRRHGGGRGAGAPPRGAGHAQGRAREAAEGIKAEIAEKERSIRRCASWAAYRTSQEQLLHCSRCASACDLVLIPAARRRGGPRAVPRARPRLALRHTPTKGSRADREGSRACVRRGATTQEPPRIARSSQTPRARMPQSTHYGGPSTR